MNAWLAQTRMNLKLTFRDRMALFFNYAFPLVFFFMFAGLNKAERGGTIVQVLTMVLTIGVLGGGFFGAGMRSVQEREANILRRFKVAPISPAPILISSLITGLLTFLPSTVLLILLSHFRYGMAFPRRWLSLLCFLSLGIVAFRSLGLIIASVVNSMQESQILIQILYFPMLLLSGATIPLSVLPSWIQILAQFLPATYLITGMQSIMGRDETFWQNSWSALALVITIVLAVFVSMKLFRWEKDEKLPARSKLWVLAVLAPFLIMGVYQARNKETIVKAKLMEREQHRSRTLLIRDVRIFTADGKTIESGGVLIKSGRIEQVYDGAVPDAKDVSADGIDGSGKTLLPGLIDVQVRLAAPGGAIAAQGDYDIGKAIPRALAAYLYSGVTAVRSAGDPLDPMQKNQQMVATGERLGAELSFCGPLFTAEGGHGTEFLKSVPANVRQTVESQMLRLPKSADEARRQVDASKTAGAGCIEAVLESGQAGMLFNRLDVDVLRAIEREAHAGNLPLAVETGDAKDVADALSVGARSIEYGSTRVAIGEDLFDRMRLQNAAYVPALTGLEAVVDAAAGNTEPLDRPLVQQVGPAKLLAATRKAVQASKSEHGGEGPNAGLAMAKENLLRAWHARAMLVTGSDSGNFMVVHGPAIHREMQLWVEAGLPPEVALRAATWNAAKLLGISDRVGAIKKGYEATMVLVSGNPMKDIQATENIQAVFFKGEHIDRSSLFEQEEK